MTPWMDNNVYITISKRLSLDMDVGADGYYTAHDTLRYSTHLIVIISGIHKGSIHENHPLGLYSSGSLISPSLFFRRFSSISLMPSRSPTAAFPPVQSTTTGHLNVSRSCFAWERTWSVVAGEPPVTKLARPPCCR